MAQRSMATKIMLIRHGEKPTDNPPSAGVGESGNQDPEELSVRGWQRAGALIRFFAPRDGVFANAGLATPDSIFASGIGQHSHSLRPQHTLSPLARALGKAVNVSHLKGEEIPLAQDVLSAGGVVLISWQHERIPAIANQILGSDLVCPQIWPSDRFDLVWILDALPDGHWSFAQIPQFLLGGDEPAPI
jgi:hypothetical protein